MSPAPTIPCPGTPPLLRVAWDGIFPLGSGKETFWLVRSDTGCIESCVDPNATEAEIAQAREALDDQNALILSLIDPASLRRDLNVSKRLSRHLSLRVRLRLDQRLFGMLDFRFYVRNRTTRHRSYSLLVSPTDMQAEIQAESLTYLFTRVTAFPPGKRAEILGGLKELYYRLVDRVVAGLPRLEHYELHSDDSSSECD